MYLFATYCLPSPPAQSIHSNPRTDGMRWHRPLRSRGARRPQSGAASWCRAKTSGGKNLPPACWPVLREICLTKGQKGEDEGYSASSQLYCKPTQHAVVLHNTRQNGRENWGENLLLLHFPSTAIMNLHALQKERKAASGRSFGLWKAYNLNSMGPPKDHGKMAKEKLSEASGKVLIHPQNSLTHKCLLAKLLEVSQN